MLSFQIRVTFLNTKYPRLLQPMGKCVITLTVIANIVLLLRDLSSSSSQAPRCVGELLGQCFTELSLTGHGPNMALCVHHSHISICVP